MGDLGVFGSFAFTLHYTFFFRGHTIAWPRKRATRSTTSASSCTTMGATATAQSCRGGGTEGRGGPGRAGGGAWGRGGEEGGPPGDSRPSGTRGGGTCLASHSPPTPSRSGVTSQRSENWWWSAPGRRGPRCQGRKGCPPRSKGGGGALGGSSQTMQYTLTEDVPHTEGCPPHG